jgi:hypothetical protein
MAVQGGEGREASVTVSILRAAEKSALAAKIVTFTVTVV